jgi:hypothetical protein
MCVKQNHRPSDYPNSLSERLRAAKQVKIDNAVTQERLRENAPSIADRKFPALEGHLNEAADAWHSVVGGRARLHVSKKVANTSLLVEMVLTGIDGREVARSVIEMREWDVSYHKLNIGFANDTSGILAAIDNWIVENFAKADAQ